MKSMRYKVGDRVYGTRDLLKIFLKEVQCLNFRDSLIARLILETLSRVSTALKLEVRDIDPKEDIINFRYKTKVNRVPISSKLKADLLKYIEETKPLRVKSDLIFMTSRKKPVTRTRITHAYAHVGKNFKPILIISPELLREIGWAIQMLNSEILK